MAALTDSIHVDRLIRLLMMLPAPGAPRYQHFWGKVAEEHHVSSGYIRGNIAGPLHQILLTPETNQQIPRKNLAKYTLFFFGEPSEDLTAAITGEIDPGSPTEAAGQLWVLQVRAAAFEVLVESSAADDHVHQACAKWMRSIQQAPTPTPGP